jgi:putative aldouronate transport system permease protein
MRRGDRPGGAFNALNVILQSFFALTMCFPFYYVVIVSLASPAAFAQSSLYILPYTFDLSAYRFLLQSNVVVSSVLVTVATVALGVAFSMAMTVTAAYALSKKTLPLRRLWMGLIVFTMFFGGQLIPYYLTIKRLGLIDNLLVMILPVGINTFYLIIIKNHFQSVPQSLEESAKLDGANDLQVLVRIFVPVSMPIMATFILFYAVERWNEWWLPLLFISKPNLKPLQIVLRETVSNLDNIASSTGRMYAARNAVNSQAVRMAMVVMTTVPILLVYPFLQKHFANGIMLGSIKG